MIETVLTMLNGNKVFWGVTMIILNMGSRFVLADLGKFHEKVLSHAIFKVIIVFSMFFVATRDVTTSFVLCALYIILVDGLFHEKRNYSIIKDFDTGISDQDYLKAKQTVMEYEQQKNAPKTIPSQPKEDIYTTYLKNLSVLSK